MPLQTVQARGQVSLTREVRRAAGIRPGDVAATRVTGPGTVEITALPRLRLADRLERYRIEGPVDEPADRARWQDEAARGGLGPRTCRTPLTASAACWTPRSSSPRL